ncbi:uncharacterized protein DUF4440 [Stella humosa]|uniref:Uncharacterized protein DUF4440 n=1 Tax=Stella humosa TaxID=94 RepID=A0A3N1KY78_9PROT|nr:nuclear transport factor 2 family protein [Stella humosa]ROP84392.1 uncharacterized protein DUF4440 [Stella humosa]BBK33908.1 hypothetical protein STHU_45420 [Stella humosa]
MTAIEDAERRLRAAMLAGDVAALDGLLMDDLVFVDQGGRVLTKAMDLEAHQSGLLRLSRLELSEVLVRPAADAVLVVVRADLAGSWDDTPFGGGFRYSRLWCRDGGLWRVAAAHCSAIAG